MFSFMFELTKDNISTFLTPGWRLLTVPKKQYRGQLTLDHDKNLELKFYVDEALIEKYNGVIGDALRKLQDECAGKSDVVFQYRVKNNSILKCKFPARAYECLMPIFVASAVNYRDILLNKGGIKKDIKRQHKDILPWFIDQNEGFTIEFDQEKAVLTDITIYDPEGKDPFVEYSRRAMLQTSYRSVLGMEFGNEDDTKLRDFYSTIHGWSLVKELNKIKPGDVKNVIYMLYDENSYGFYVGRADDLRVRLDGHRNKADDPIPNFTHFRYSIIDDQYIDYSYYIEDAAIHDCAAVLEMDKRRKLKSSLQNAIKTQKAQGDLNKVHMVNTAESQAHLRNKK